MTATSHETALTRRHDLDAIRVGAFLLLILYHVGMFYVPWDWHVKSPRLVDGLEPVLLLTSPWRLTLLFLVSGSATRFLVESFAARGRGAGALAGSRLLRLLPPVLFGMTVIVPPQTYYEIVEALQASGVADPARHAALSDFWLRYLTASGAWCGPDGCLSTPTWNHLWFVVYLLVYSLILAGLIAVPGVFSRLASIGDRMGGAALILLPLAVLIFIRLVLAPRFDVTHALVDDWANHALSFGAFLFGFLIARSEPARQTFLRLRRPALAIALASWAAWATWAWVWRAADAAPSELLRMAMGVVFAVDQWAFVVAILGFGARWLTRGGPILRYLSVGVFPVYIVHQTLIIVIGHHLAPWGLPLIVEALLLIMATLAGGLLTYEIARRMGGFGLLLGVSPTAARPSPSGEASFTSPTSVAPALSPAGLDAKAARKRTRQDPPASRADP